MNFEHEGVGETHTDPTRETIKLMNSDDTKITKHDQTKISIEGVEEDPVRHGRKLHDMYGHLGRPHGHCSMLAGAPEAHCQVARVFCAVHTSFNTDKHRKTQTHRHTDTHRHTQTDTQTHTDTHTDTQTHRHTETQTQTHTDLMQNVQRLKATSEQTRLGTHSQLVHFFENDGLT